MNPNRLNEIRARTEKATPGPWERTGTRGQLIYSILSVDEYDISSVVLDVWGEKVEKVDANAEFIAHAREDIPHLLGEVQSLKIQLECRIEERDQLGLDLNMANLNLDDLAEQLAESQRREQAAVELLIHGCETCANARVDGCCTLLQDGDAFSPDYVEGFDRDYCEHWEWSGPQDAGKGNADV